MLTKVESLQNIEMKNNINKENFWRYETDFHQLRRMYHTTHSVSSENESDYESRSCKETVISVL